MPVKQQCGKSSISPGPSSGVSNRRPPGQIPCKAKFSWPLVFSKIYIKCYHLKV